MTACFFFLSKFFELFTNRGGCGRKIVISLREMRGECFSRPFHRPIRRFLRWIA
jgi:hypothetical protein